MPVIRRRLGSALLALPLACTLPNAVGAASEPAAPAAPERVEVTGTPPGGDGRDSTASRMVISREEIARHGDTSVVDVLRRVPGITVAGFDCSLPS